MGLTVGPAQWHPSYLGGIALGTFICGGYLFRKDDGLAWIVAPYSTQVSATWNGTTNTTVGNKCCVSDWSSLNTALTNAGLTPSQWFVPSASTYYTIAYPCRAFWGPSPCLNSAYYWSSTEHNDTSACASFEDSAPQQRSKSNTNCVRAFRCVTY